MSDDIWFPFDELDREIRAYALVGYYLNAWSVMETALNECISKALRLDDLQSVVVTKNIQFQGKVKVMRTLADLLFKNHDKQAQHDKTLLSMSKLSIDRNMVAHDMFLPAKEGDGVEFLVVKASAKLKLDNTIWSIRDVQDRVTHLMEVTTDLRDMQKDMSAKRVMDALQAAPPKNSLWNALALLSQESPQPPSPQDYPPPETKNAKSPEASKE